MSDLDFQKKIVNHLKNYGFVIQNSAIYNGLANAWDFGPLGACSSFKLKKLWLDTFVFSQGNVYLIDSNIIYNSKVWQASGHCKNFTDALVECKNCHQRFRPDKLIEQKQLPRIESDNFDALQALINEKVSCPNCGINNWTKIRKFNLMFQTRQGVIENNEDLLFLRPETAQGIFINYNYVLRTMRCKLPFGIAQIGKAFRNEVNPGNFIFRTREFEQMEIEWFCKPQTALVDFKRIENQISNFLLQKLQIRDENLRRYEQQHDELAHYAKKTVDFQFHFPHGWDELLGLAYRGDFDLLQHQIHSGVNLEYNDNDNQKIIPHVIEPSFGLNRLLYAVFTNAYVEEILPDLSVRVVLKLPAALAPYEVAILPLVKKLNTTSQRIFRKILANQINACIDFSGSIGRRYRRQDAIGTPLCVTVDFESIKKQNPTVTIRNRDTMKQTKCKIKLLINRLIALTKKM